MLWGQKYQEWGNVELSVSKCPISSAKKALQYRAYLTVVLATFVVLEILSVVLEFANVADFLAFILF